MQFNVDRSLFADTVNWAAKVLPARPASPILSGIKLEATFPNSITISSFDYEISARETINADVEEEGVILVAGKLLAEITRSLPADNVRCRTQDGKLEVVSGNSRYMLQEMPISDYPKLPPIPPSIGSISADDFRATVGRVAFAAATREEANPIFSGAKLDFNDDELSLIATDKVRLAVFSAPFSGKGAEIPAPVIVKARVLQEVARSLLPEQPQVEIGLALEGGISAISFTNGSRITTTQLIDGAFPNVLGLFADSYPIKVTLSREALAAALKRVALVSDREVTLRFRQGEVELAAGQGEEANAAEILPATLEGEDITIALRPSFLTDGLSALSNDFASLHLTHPIKPVELRGTDSIEQPGDNTFRYLFVPIRIAG